MSQDVHIIHSNIAAVGKKLKSPPSLVVKLPHLYCSSQGIV